MGHARDFRTRNIELVDSKQSLLVSTHSATLGFFDIGRDQHVRAIRSKVELFRYVFPQYCRRERPKAPAIFDLQIEARLHAWRSRVAQDRTRAERARTEFHTTLKPSHRLLPGKGLSCRRDHLVLAEHGERCSGCGHSPLDLPLREARTEIRTAHSIRTIGFARLAFEEMVGCEGCSHGTAGIARGRLNPDAIEAAVPQNPSVGDAIERYAASEAKISRAGLFSKAARQPQHGLIQHRLDRGSNIHVKACQQMIGASHRLSKQCGKTIVGHGEAGAVVEVRHIDLKPDGSFRLDMSYFYYCTGFTMTNDRFAALFGEPVRSPDHLLTSFHMDVAASVQSVLDEAVLRLTRSLAKQTGSRNLCLAGGVALNCVANGRVLRDGRFDSIWIQPAAGDAAGAVGAALAAYHLFKGQPRETNGADGMCGAYLGPSFSQGEIEWRMTAAGATFAVLGEDEMIATTAEALAGQKAVGWFQGRMEFGPRSLGARSILGDPRSPGMQTSLNLKVKYRESFRPFAPAVLREDVPE